MPGVFEGVRVLDVSQGIAGAMCARFLADYGADVIKVEPPEGDTLRTAGPWFRNTPHPEHSIPFLLANLNKRGVTLRLEHADGKRIFRDLAHTADVIVESAKPGHMSSLGLGYDDLSAVNPAAIVTSVTGFGQTGPYRDFDGDELIYYAMSGIMSISGYADREPLKHGGSQAQFEAGLVGAAATAIALVSQAMSGEGQHVDLSITEVVTSSLIETQPLYAFRGGVGNRRPPHGRLFDDLIPCKDGYIAVTMGGAAVGWPTLCEFLGRPDLNVHTFASTRSRNDHGDELDVAIVDALKDKGKWELFHGAAPRRLLFGLVQTPEELFNCPHLASRGFFRQVDHPVMGRINVPAVLFNYSDAPYELRYAAPTLGQHNTEVYGELGTGGAELARLRKAGVV